MTLDFAASFAALDTTVLASLERVAGISCTGPAALSFLQGQVSQDLDPLAVGDSVEALLLSPQGKLEALVRVVRTGDDRFLVVGEAQLATEIEQRLRRFKIRVRAELVPVPLACLLLAARPVGTGRAAAYAAGVRLALSGDHVGFDPGWPGLETAGVLGEPEDLERATADLERADRSALESLRITAGVPEAQAELDERTIAEEAGLVRRAVSFTKGCFTGQELVARLDARGANVARRLRLVRIAAAGGAPRPGDTALVEGKVRGELTSVAPGENGGYVALGYFRRGIDPPATLEFDGAAGSYAGDILELPEIIGPTTS